MDRDPSQNYAVMWASTSNIGDDIQTLAAINFLKKKGIEKYSFIDREYLSDYDGDAVNLIMNGWFMHNLKKFPPSKNINPIFISFHVNKEKLVKKNKKYLKLHEPIGCRDFHTVQLLEKYGIRSYFTGCLTLFFDKVNEKSGKKYLVDVNTECDYIPNIELDHSKYGDFELIGHEIQNFDYNDLDKRLLHANELLDVYRTAGLVVTTRLHCLLPCRAFGTKALLFHKNYHTDPRFSGLRNVINGHDHQHDSTDYDSESVNNIRDFFNNFEL